MWKKTKETPFTFGVYLHPQDRAAPREPGRAAGAVRRGGPHPPRLHGGLALLPSAQI